MLKRGNFDLAKSFPGNSASILFMESTRPCFLVIDREHSGSISTRKLVIETAKFNVLTAYSPAEGLETLRRFPAIDGVVMNADLRDLGCNEFIALLRKIVAAVPVVVVGPNPSSDCNKATHQVDSFEPQRLLEALRQMCTKQAEAIERRNEKLDEQE